MDSTYNTMPNTTDAEISDNINSMLMSIIETIIDNIVTAGRMETSSPTCDNSSPVTVAEGRNNDDNINDDNINDDNINDDNIMTTTSMTTTSMTTTNLTE